MTWLKNIFNNKNNILLFLVFSIIIISRGVLLGNGPGLDADGWRTIKSGFLFAQTGVYEPSRFPGYPIPEFFHTIVYLLKITDFRVIDSFTFLFFITGLIFFYKILKQEIKTEFPLLITTTFAFTPIVFIYSTASIDYFWSLCFIFISFYLLIKGSYSWSGIFLGIASGCRPTAIFFLIAYFYYIGQKNESYFNKCFLRTAGLAILVSLLAYFPLFLKYGLSFLTYYPATYPGILVIFGRIFIKTLGIPGAVAFFIFSFISIITYKKNIAYNQNRVVLITCIIIIVVYILLFLKLPSGAGYLVPLIPFLFILLSYIFPKKLFISFCLIIILSSFVFNVT